MARTKPSPAHLALVQIIEEVGCTVTTTQLERWQQHGWLPKTSAWCEPGSIALRRDILTRALWLASTARAGRSIGWLGWVFWAMDETPDTAERLRTALVETLKRPLARAGIEQIPTGNSDKAFQARQDAAAKMLENRRFPRRDLDETLRAHAAEVGLELPRSSAPSLPNIFHRALMDPGARLLLGGAADVGTEDQLDALEQAMPDHPEAIEHLREALRRSELAGTDLLAQSPLAQGITGMVRTIETADDRALCHAVRTCTKASGVLAVLMRRAPDQPEILAQLTGDVMWEQWARVGGILPESPAVVAAAAVAINTFQYLAMPDWAADLDRYLSFMNALLEAPKSVEEAEE
ncbi:hypothetical protein ACFVGY_14655 [Streptomyces sp. NPDC127106]|uniref:hypothetical protein n=1 Tax=Streptomyces sp. NPDC127106 TaxID=3345360 RepID=UPI0036320F50